MLSDKYFPSYEFFKFFFIFGKNEFQNEVTKGSQACLRFQLKLIGKHIPDNSIPSGEN